MPALHCVNMSHGCLFAFLTEGNYHTSPAEAEVRIQYSISMPTVMQLQAYHCALTLMRCIHLCRYQIYRDEELLGVLQD